MRPPKPLRRLMAAWLARVQRRNAAGRKAARKLKTKEKSE